MTLFSQFRGLLQTDIALDVGTANTRIYSRDKGMVLDEASVICVSSGGQTDASVLQTQVVGGEAKRMLGRLPRNIEAIRPIHGGVIAHFSETQRMIGEFIKMGRARRMLSASLHATVGVPSGATQVERRAIKEAIQGAGVTHVMLLEKPIAAALGAGVAVFDAIGSLVVDIGAGSTEIGVVALGSVAHKASARVGGDTFDRAIINHLRRARGLLIGEQTAERIKHEIGCAIAGDDETCVEVTGHNLSEGIPRTLQVSSSEVFEALCDPLNQIVSLLKSALERTPPELATDIADRGIVLSGGSARLHSMDRRLAQETGLRVLVATDPMTCVVRGMGMAIDSLQSYCFE
ncbi:rod shape-determining protein [Paraburkholderia caffeinilytica]|uniref:Cell shape-determining protein MreB n=1 Tax=Paraburkholderia caffeinilytica TaxID=1761016 RepID=A0ABQ1LL72_9BURK|nr:rod shape-determining protein [Paraburkholderia caffeinilytica]AXL53752.1 rod shape-determining protein [Paraburkholderia caffeinilytica]GGC26085.1 rod shape-determining protein [Paraburkholderia caffeinilytica]CAB3807904.1 Cell shape-determining protein MreB [Paraburkholderia caffeinilytica]